MGLGKTLAELESLSPDELLGWQAFYDLEPWGCGVEDHRFETLAYLMFATASKKGAAVPRFFDRDPQPTPPPATPEELDNKIRDALSGFRIIKKKARKPRKPRSPDK